MKQSVSRVLALAGVAVGVHAQACNDLLGQASIIIRDGKVIAQTPQGEKELTPEANRKPLNEPEVQIAAKVAVVEAPQEKTVIVTRPAVAFQAKGVETQDEMGASIAKSVMEALEKVLKDTNLTPQDREEVRKAMETVRKELSKMRTELRAVPGKPSPEAIQKLKELRVAPKPVQPNVFKFAFPPDQKMSDAEREEFRRAMKEAEKAMAEAHKEMAKAFGELNFGHEGQVLKMKQAQEEMAKARSAQAGAMAEMAKGMAEMRHLPGGAVMIRPGAPEMKAMQERISQLERRVAAQEAELKRLRGQKAAPAKPATPAKPAVPKKAAPKIDIKSTRIK